MNYMKPQLNLVQNILNIQRIFVGLKYLSKSQLDIIKI